MARRRDFVTFRFNANTCEARIGFAGHDYTVDMAPMSKTDRGKLAMRLFDWVRGGAKGVPTTA